jgi:hypothetical protein
MEVYQWLLRKNNFEVSDTGYFVYVNGQRDKEAFDAKLEFDVNIIPYNGRADWVDDVLPKIKNCLMSDDIPKSGQACEYCEYRESAGNAFKDFVLSKKVTNEKKTPKKKVKETEESEDEKLTKSLF